MVGKKRVDLVNVAKSQKLLLIGLAATIGSYIIPILSAAAQVSGLLEQVMGSVFVVIWLGGVVIVVMGIFRLARAVGSNMFWAVCFCIVVFTPIIGLLVMALQSNKATKVLKEAGVKVGLLGVSKEEMKKLVEGVCRQCGYDMRTLAGRTCPECGAKVG
jgi:hypothetical protein